MTIKHVTQIAAGSINFRCPHCDLVISMGSENIRVGVPFKCFCKRDIVIPEGTMLQVPLLNMNIKLTK
jgi:hypothetical protein